MNRTQHTTWITKSLSILWRSATLLLVILAVLITAIRLSLPHVNQAKAPIEEFLSQQLNANVVIGQIDGYWEGNGPHLTLHDVILDANLNVDSQAQGIEFQLANIYVELDLIASLLQWAVVTDKFELQGLALDVNPALLSQTQPSDSAASLPELLQDLLLNKLEYFSIVDSTVTLQQLNTAQTIAIKQLSWLNNQAMHKGTGEVFFNNNPAHSAHVSARLIGRPDNLSGVVFLKTNKVAFGSWLTPYLPETIELDQSAAYANAWISIDKTRITKIQGQIEPTQLRWIKGNERLLSTIDNLDFMALPNGEDWTFNAQNIQLSINDSRLHTQFSGQLFANGDIAIHSTRPFALDSFREVAEFVAPPAMQAWLQEAAPTAAMTQLQWAITQTASVGVIQLSDIQLAQTQYPGISQAHMSMHYHDAHTDTPAALHVQTTLAQQTLSVDKLLAQDIPIESLNASMYMLLATDFWSLLPSQIQLDSDLIDATIDLAYDGSEDLLEVSATLAPQTVQHVVQLLPTSLIGSNTYQYLSTALGTERQAGVIETARLLWHGSPQGFPFERNDGIFQARVAMRSGEFAFAQSWPALTELDLDLSYNNADLFLSAPSGKLDDIHLSELTASLPSANTVTTTQNGPNQPYIPTLTIDAAGAGTGYALAQLMAKSSLADSLGVLFNNNLIISNALSAQLHFDIPLDSSPITTSGEVNLPNNYIHFTDIDLVLSQTKGQIHFINDNISASGITAQLFDQPITASLQANNDANGYVTNVGLSGRWDMAKLAALANSDYTQAVSGSANWTGSLDLAFAQDDMNYSFSVASDLVGVNQYLPAPLNKTADEIVPLSIVISGNALASEVNASFGDDVRFVGALPHKEKQFSRAHLALGQSDFEGMGVGFSISAALPTLDVTAWYQTLDLLLSGMSQSEHPLFGTPERIFMDIEQMTFANQSINRVNAIAKQADDNWQINLNAQEARATIKLFNDWLGNGIDIQADYINFSEWNSAPNPQEHTSDNRLLANSLQPHTLPPIALTCTQCRILDNNIGEIVLRTKPTANGMRIEQFSTQNDHGGITLTGDWLQLDSGLSETYVDGQLVSDDFGAFLKEFNFTTGIKDSEAQFAFDLNWEKAPFDFAFTTVDGNVDWSLSDGYITEISDKGSRIFTLLSLDSLVRKLSLDFRDVFAKGFFYDKINGTMEILNGIAYTQDTVVDGGAGEIEIAGYTDLVEQNLNYTVSFAPNVTGNLPALVYFMVNPPTAIAALAVNQMLTSAKVFSNINYSISGQFTDPQITELDRESREIIIPRRTNAQVIQDEDVPLTELDKVPMNIQPPVDQ